MRAGKSSRNRDSLPKMFGEEGEGRIMHISTVCCVRVPNCGFDIAVKNRDRSAESTAREKQA